MRDLSATELHAHLATAKEPPLLLDVREEWEYRICHLEGSVLIPMGTLPAALGNLDPQRETVVVCHHGVRSRMVCSWLESNGFTDVVNLTGGVDAWTREVDPEFPTY